MKVLCLIIFIIMMIGVGVYSKTRVKSANDFFLGDVRIFSAFSLYIADFLNLSIEIFVVIMDFFAIVISCISVMLIYKLFVKLLKFEDKTIYNYLTLIGSYIIIFRY